MNGMLYRQIGVEDKSTDDNSWPDNGKLSTNAEIRKGTTGEEGGENSSFKPK